MKNKSWYANCHTPVMLQVETLKTRKYTKYLCSSVGFIGKYVQADIVTPNGIRSRSFDTDKYQCIFGGLSNQFIADEYIRVGFMDFIDNEVKA